jgi:hypothetical protein
VEKEVPALQKNKQHVNHHFSAIVRKNSFNKPIRVEFFGKVQSLESEVQWLNCRFCRVLSGYAWTFSLFWIILGTGCAVPPQAG